MNVTSVLSDDRRCLTVSIEGSFDNTLMDEFRATYSEYIYSDMSYIVDFRLVEKIDSSGLGILLSMRTLLGSGADIYIVHCNHYIKSILEQFRFENKFNIHNLF